MRRFAVVKHVAAPETLLPIPQTASGEVLSGSEGDLESGIDLCVVPPVEFVHVFESDGAKECLVSCRNEHGGCEALVEPRQCVQIHVVVVIMSEKDEADIRELIKRDARFSYTGGTKPTEGTYASRPDRVGQDIQAGDLE